MTYVVFDFGGTNTRVARSDDGTTLNAVQSFQTPRNFKTAMRQFLNVVSELGVEAPQGFAGGIRGTLNEEHTGIENDGVLSDWAGKSIAAAVHAVFPNTTFLLENDTAVAGLGEAHYGAGRNFPIVAYHAVSTGVGGVRIDNGVIDAYAVGFEPGHQILDIDRTILGDEVEPTLENLVSGTAVSNRFGVPAHEIAQDDVIWDELAEYLAQGLRNSIMYWSPDAIVLGGAMITGDPAIPLDAIRKYTVVALDGFVPAPLITGAMLGDDMGLYGGLVLLKQHETTYSTDS